MRPSFHTSARQSFCSVPARTVAKSPSVSSTARPPRPSPACSATSSSSACSATSSSSACSAASSSSACSAAASEEPISLPAASSAAPIRPSAEGSVSSGRPRPVDHRTTDTHFYDGHMRETAERVMRLWRDDLPSVDDAYVRVREAFQSIAHPLKTQAERALAIVKMSTTVNLDPLTNTDALQLLRILAYLLSSSSDPTGLNQVVTECFSDMMGGLCTVGRTTRLIMLIQAIAGL